MYYTSTLPFITLSSSMLPFVVDGFASVACPTSFPTLPKFNPTFVWTYDSCSHNFYRGFEISLDYPETQSVRFKSSFLTQNTISVIFPTFWFLIWSNLTTVNQFWPFVTAIDRDDYLQKYWGPLKRFRGRVSRGLKEFS